MKRYFCDRCGEEMSKGDYETRTPRFDISKFNTDKDSWWERIVLCNKCSDELEKWFEELKK